MALRSMQGEATTRPQLSMEIDVKDLHDYYWVKDELVAFCKRAAGSKERGWDDRAAVEG